MPSKMSDEIDRQKGIRARQTNTDIGFVLGFMYFIIIISAFQSF